MVQAIREQTIEIARISANAAIYINSHAVIIDSEVGFSENFSFNDADLQTATDFGNALNQVLPILVEQEIVVPVDGKLEIPFENVHELYDEEYGLLNWLPDFCPYTLGVDAVEWIGSPSFKYNYQFYSGLREVSARVIGCFVKKASFIYCLPESLYEMIKRLDEFNTLPPEQKDKTNALLAFAPIKLLAKKNGVDLDKYLRTENVVLPEKVELDIDQDGSGRISLIPNFESVPTDLLRKEYLRHGEAQQVYDLDTADGGKLRVVLTPELHQAVSKMRSVNRIGGKQKDKILAEPREIFAGITDPDCVDLSSFGPRVKGIGPYVFQPKPYIKRLSSGFLDEEDIDIFKKNDSGKPSYEVGIQALDGDGNRVKILFPDESAFISAYKNVHSAIQRGDASVSLKDEDGQQRIIPLTTEVMGGVEYLHKEFCTRNDRMPKATAEVCETAGGPLEDTKQPGKKAEANRYVLIYDNEDSLDYAEHGSDADESAKLKFEQPRNLNKLYGDKPLELKGYQKEGIAWLQTRLNEFLNKRNGRRGLLLADDMGLGKTLQVLAFLCWFIESEHASLAGKSSGTYNPILIVAPLILLETWENELKKFFANDGEVFMPYAILHGGSLRQYRQGGLKGREYTYGAASLNLDDLRSNRLIITNYDTVKNYQHSFAQMEWSIVVVDEAQEIKEPKTAVTHAVKMLNALFKIALTGTPVENRLLDLWNIMDFAQPGLLGTAKDFSQLFESDLDGLEIDERNNRAEMLREKLRYNRPDAYLVRRTKEDNLDGLPQKSIKVIPSGLSTEQVEAHYEILRAAKSGDDGKIGGHLAAIQRLNKMYQHIALLEESTVDKNPQYYLKTSPKLRSLVNLLHEIRQQGEKVLIFAIYNRMQMILKRVIDNEFGLNVDVINGSLKGKSSQLGTNIRHQKISEFESRSGFNALILSPDVAGVGLTIVGANHVIHYGRWWNPAKEAQATDRAYRLGQTKDVTVYYPVSVADGFSTFDEKLNSLLERKREIAKDFLMPTTSLAVSETEIFNDLASAATVGGKNVMARKVEINTVKDLTPSLFESLIAALWKSSGYEVYLTPQGQNGGVDVMAVNGSEVNLILCKQGLSSSSIGEAEYRELKGSTEFFREKILPVSMRRRTCKLLFVTSGMISKEFIDSAKRDGITVLANQELEALLNRYPANHGDLYGQEERRYAKLGEIVETLKSSKFI